MTAISPEGQRVLARYADRGWFDAANDPRLRDDYSPWKLPRPAYLVIASGVLVPPASEVQVTTRCNYRTFRGRWLAVMSEAARRFDLVDLKVRYRSQFRRDEALSLRGCVDEASLELIQWLLEICGSGDEVSARAIIPTCTIGEENDLGAVFEIILLGEVL